MGLIDLKTDLKSLRYGKDTIGGGYSGQPYIQTPIPESFNDLGANEDFILRGGINAVRDSVTDIKRLTKMFFDLKSPNGLLFIAKQNLLSQTAVRTQTSGVINEGIYTPLNTLAEAGVVAFGGHLNKQGVNPFIYTGAYANNDNLYYTRMINYNIEAIQSPDGILKNRLVALQQSKILNISIGGFDKTSNISSLPSDILTYDGGPGSNLGVGKTNIRFASQRTGINNPLWNSYVNNISSWTAPQDARGFRANGVVTEEDYKYNPLLTGISEKGGIYDELLGVGFKEYDNRDLDGNILQSNNVYKPGSLEPYTPVTQGQKIQTTVNVDNVRVGGLQVNTEKPWIKSSLYELPDFTVNSPQSGSLSKIPTGPLTWTAKQDVTGSNGTTYRISTPTGINYNINNSKGVTNTSLIFTDLTLGASQFTFLNPSVYQPVVKDQELLSPNDEKIGGTNIAKANGTITYNQQDLATAEPSRYSPAIKEDFRKVLRKKITNNTVAESYLNTGRIVDETYIDYATQNIGAKTKLGNPGTKVKNLSKFTKGTGNVLTRDLINESDIGTSWDDAKKGSKNDLVTFNISNLGGGKTLNFRAFLNTFSDSYNATINSQQMVGRGENFYTYGGFNRKISLSWTVAALSREELIPMHKKLSYLASNTAPEYSANGFMKGPLVQLTVGGYLKDMPGYIESISLDYITEMPWEIAITEDGAKDNTISQLSHMVKVNSFSFIPIPNYLSERGANFIELIKGDGVGNLW